MRANIYFSYAPPGPVPRRWSVYLKQRRRMCDVCKFFFDSSSVSGVRLSCFLCVYWRAGGRKKPLCVLNEKRTMIRSVQGSQLQPGGRSVKEVRAAPTQERQPPQACRIPEVACCLLPNNKRASLTQGPASLGNLWISLLGRRLEPYGLMPRPCFILTGFAPLGPETSTSLQ